MPHKLRNEIVIHLKKDNSNLYCSVLSTPEIKKNGKKKL